MFNHIIKGLTPFLIKGLTPFLTPFLDYGVSLESLVKIGGSKRDGLILVSYENDNHALMTSGSV